MTMETKSYKLEEIAKSFYYGSMPQEKMICDSGYPIFTGYRYIGYYSEYNISRRSIVVVARGVGGTGNVRIAEEKTFLTNLSIAVDIDTSIVDIDYLKHYLNIQGLRYLDSGAAQSQITINSLKRHRVFLPELRAQKSIVAVLSAYDNLIEVNNKKIKVLEQMEENLYKEWFVRFRFPGHETAEFENGIPMGWEYSTVDSLSSVLQRGISPDYDDAGNLTVISQKCIRQNIMDIRESRQQTKPFKSELNLIDGDTVICSTGTGTLGRVGQVYGEYPDTTFDSHVTLVRARKNIGKHFLYWTLKEMQPWFMNMGIGSTNQQELYRGTIKNAKAICPDNKLVAQFETIIEPIHQNIISLIKSQDNLIKQRDLLLPRLMSGRLEV